MQLPRQTLKNLASAKKADAQLLFEHKRYSNSYYLYGYAIELALKSVVALQFSENAIPDRQLVNKIYTHRLNDLVGYAGLREKHSNELKIQEFSAHWVVVERWSEESRYELVDVVNATAMHQAVQHETFGVFQWITKHW